MRPLPPLRALQAFEATARHLSVSGAAAELCVTPSAVSHQITGLERHLGVRLFHRLNRRIALTDAGRGYVQLLASGFDRIARATEHIASGRGSDVLTVHCLPSFAPAWLVPRLAGFMAEHPEIDLRIHATPEPAEFFRSDTDVELRYGTGEWPGLDVIPVMSDAVVPVAAPALRERLPPDPKPADILGLPLIHSERALVGWTEWSRALGIEAVPSRGGLRFDRGYLAIQAAAEGLGVALETRVFIAREVELGRVVPLLPREVPAGGHYLVYPAIYAGLPKVAAFRAWLLKAAASSY
ncbi:MAG TPA: transcriptional regulator GcvA [Salinarimonas sp.]|jgi:LysR family glycine cleavage system transcriptional activator|nr:transcriptional regulator GcvA [Salinarimonas sp.]